jgi:serine/threonine protein kinase/Flp pilus assembly protein TadD
MTPVHDDRAGSGQSPSADRPGDQERIGPYRLLTVVGEGGMGIVYVAEQTEPVRRRVALKVMKVGMDTKEVVARFEAERQALAVMDHPGIAKVFDAGASESGRPFFVMELVRGVTLTAYCDGNRLTVEDRLRLFVKVCQAVQHAHQKGVIHRDLKPSNVLVTLEGDTAVPKIIDFGIAKAVSQRLTEKTLVTDFGQIMGTPAYMSPEQAEMSGLDVDTRTDIYALGVMLYEVLVGELPVDPMQLGMPAFIAQLVMRQQDPATPSARLSAVQGRRQVIAESRRTEFGSLHRAIKGDLDRIVMKAMDPDRTRRYETANGLAMDIQRFLANEPIVARPASTAYRIGKFVRRHRAAVAGASVAAIALVLGALTAMSGLVRARRAETAARQEAEAAKQVSDFLVALFRVSDPGEARGNTITAREILDRGAERISGQLAQQPVVQARMMYTMGEVYVGLGLYGEATRLLDGALGLRREKLGPEDSTVAATLIALGNVAREQGAFDRADSLFGQALDIRRRTLRPNDPRIAAAMKGVAGVDLARGHYAAAIPGLEQVLDQETRLRVGDTTLAGTLADLGIAYWGLNRLGQAEEFLRRSLAIRERALPPDHPDLALTLNNLGAVYWTEGNYHSAEQMYLRAQAIYQKILPPEHIQIAKILNNLGETYWAEGKLAEAEPLFRRSLAIKQKLLKPNHPSFATTYQGLANVLRDLGRYREAESYYRRALDIRQTVVGPSSPDVAETLEAYAKLLRETQRPDSATLLEARARAIRAQ